jgi:hypothetical protein
MKPDTLIFNLVLLYFPIYPWMQICYFIFCSAFCFPLGALQNQKDHPANTLHARRLFPGKYTIPENGISLKSEGAITVSLPSVRQHIYVG